MIKWLIKSQNEFRLETMSDVEEFHKELQKEAENGGYTLTNFSWAEKAIKEKGEIVENYFQVKATFVFNTLKEPENPFTKVEYYKIENINNFEGDC